MIKINFRWLKKDFKLNKYIHSINFKLIAVVIIVVSISLFSLGYIINSEITKGLKEETHQNNLDIVELIKKESSKFFLGSEKSLSRVAEDYGLRSNNQAELVAKRKFREEMENYDYFSTMFYLGADGSYTVLSEGESIDYNFSQKEEWLAKAREKKETFWTATHSDISGDRLTITAVRPVRDYSDNFIGIVAANISTTNLSEIISWQIGEAGFVYLTDSSGKVIAHTDQGLLKNRIDMSEHLNMEELLVSKEIKTINYENEEFLLSYVKIDKINGALLAQVPSSQAYSLMNKIRNTVITSAFVILIMLVLLLFVFIRKTLIKPILFLEQELDKAEKGNFELKLDLNRQDEIGKLSSGFQNLLRKISLILKNVEQLSEELLISSDSINSATSEIMLSTQENQEVFVRVKEGADIQENNIEEIHQKTMLLAEDIKKLKNNNDLLSESSVLMNKSTEEGRESIEDVKKQMLVIKEKIEMVSEDISALISLSDDIDNILDVINGISKQTNLLALNASIEAARAGQAGRGFSVVAEEIRELSEESRDSAERISKLIREIKSETHKAGENMAAGKEELNTGIKTVSKNTQSYLQIRKSLDNVNQAIDKSYNSAEDADKNIKNILKNMGNISKISQENTNLSAKAQLQSKDQLKEIQEIDQQSEGLVQIINSLKKLIKNIKMGSEIKYSD
ncbi:methyl-accepting chemotaxis protein [Halanaerobium kushneri]|uniref:Methyl-accepting chemotaxis protein n=1 Tax=Halanaerobium kushneri TaxID=56779 RepID=A0A1N6WMX6_9FIRM|nr:methyl-accepting chemotaxis protein [Halanaerobium kushneri]SIQ91382.1 methyl-accepting chemotaxis protein [Halanaerobium kushneri]